MPFDFAIGIDPGLHGAIVAIALHREGFTLTHAYPMPLTHDKSDVAVKGLVTYLRSMPIKNIFLEQAVACAFAFRGGGRQSVASGFTCGSNFGRITGALDLAGIQYTSVTPRMWTAKMHKGVKAETSKEKSLAVFKKLCTKDSQSKAILPRCRVMHDGVIDAALIAYWGATIE